MQVLGEIDRARHVSPLGPVARPDRPARPARIIRRSATGAQVCATLPRMPELPDVTVYVEHLERRLAGATLARRSRSRSPILLRTVDAAARGGAGRRVLGVRRIGKRIVIALEGELFLVLHLMIAGRLRWKARRARSRPGKIGLAAFDFSTRHAAAHRGGHEAARRRSTSSRAPTALARARPRRARAARGRRSPRSARRCGARTTRSSARSPIRALFSGIGNAYSDEILHRARLSPLQLHAASSTTRRSRGCTRRRARCWPSGPSGCAREAGDGFPEKVTAFRDGMAVHGRYAPALPRLRRAGAAHRLRRATRRTTARAARPAAGCSPTARSRGCSRTTGRARSRSWKKVGRDAESRPAREPRQKVRGPSLAPSCGPATLGRGRTRAVSGAGRRSARGRSPAPS